MLKYVFPGSQEAAVFCRLNKIQEDRVMADILVNKAQWEALSKDERDKITKGLTECGALSDKDSVVGDASVAPFDENTQLQPLWNPLQDLCKAACDVAAGTALAWCTANTVGIGLAACIAVAEAARNECKNNC